MFFCLAYSGQPGLFSILELTVQRGIADCEGGKGLWNSLCHDVFVLREGCSEWLRGIMLANGRIEFRKS
jgi:hypothetical protein